MAGSCSATAPRGSIEFTTIRLLTSDSSVTVAALAKAAFTAPASPVSQSTQRLPGASSQTSGAPSADALSMSDTAGSASYDTDDQLGRVAGLLQGFGDHQRHGVADVPDAVAGQQGVGGADRPAGRRFP